MVKKSKEVGGVAKKVASDLGRTPSVLITPAPDADLPSSKVKFDFNDGRPAAFQLPSDNPREYQTDDNPRIRGTILMEPTSKTTPKRLRLKNEQPENVQRTSEAEKMEMQLAAEERKKSKWLELVKEYAAIADVFAAAHTVPKHQVCIGVAAVMIPMSLISITWDILAAIVFEIPHLSTINAPAFILFINFIAMPLAMYGYMMEYLMHEHSRLAIIGLICVIIHPLLFLGRAFMEYQFDGFRNEMKLYFEHPEDAEEFEYPIGTLNSNNPVKAF